MPNDSIIDLTIFKENENFSKNVLLALREIGEGKLDVKDLKNDSINRLRKEPDEVLQEQEIEEISNDNFEKELSTGPQYHRSDD